MYSQDETDIEVKNKMLEYLADLMEDARIFPGHPPKLPMQLLYAGWKTGSCRGVTLKV